MIITDEKLLRKTCEKVEINEAYEIITKLENELIYFKDGIGLSAPQIGIFKQVAIIRGPYNINIVNPCDIKLSDEKFIFKQEGCLSFPNLRKNTVRHVSIEYKDEITNINKFNNKDILSLVAVQHEIDHLFGKLFIDHMMNPALSNKIGRNKLGF